ncbi:MAG: permease [Polyangiales bacterium]
MTLAYSFALLSTLLGTVLGLSGGQGRVSGPLRSFAFVAAIAVVFGQLLPEALSEAGPIVILVFGAGVLVPRLLFHHHHGPGHGHGRTHGPDQFDDDGAHIRAGLLLGLFAMMLHQVGDGVALGAFASGAHAEHMHIDLFSAIAAHTVPVVGLLVHAFVQHWGRRIAALQGVALALSSVVGVALAGAISTSAAVAFTPYITACAAGLLIHVVSHDRPPEGPRDGLARVLDVLAVIAGVLLVSQSGHAHGEYEGQRHSDSAHSVTDALLDLALDAAPPLLLGLLVAGFVQSRRRVLPGRFAHGTEPLTLALRGAVVGAPLPLCSCGVLPVAHAVRSRGGAAAFVVAFLLATPELGAETLLMTGRFLGPGLLVARFVGALAVAVAAACAAGWALRRSPTDAAPCPDLPLDVGRTGLTQTLHRMDELFVHILPFTMVGLLAAAYADVTLAPDALTGLRRGSLDVLLMTAVSVPLYVSAASAAPLAAVLVSKGLSAGAVLVGLVLGPATNLATLGFMRASFGARATLAAVVAALGTAFLLALGVNAAELGAETTAAHGSVDAHGGSHGLVAYGGLAVLIGWLLRTVYVQGVNALFDGLKVSRFDPRRGHTGAHPPDRLPDGGSVAEGTRATDDGHDAERGHGHGHGHAHGRDARHGHAR